MKLPNRLNNIYVIDTNMFGYDQYSAAYIIEGKEIALVDCGLPTKLEIVRAAIKAHGFSVSDISHIFITHAHKDHCGNVGPLLRESPKASVYINPVMLEHLTDPTIATARDSQLMPPSMTAGIGVMEPVPQSRIKFLKDGDVFDLGNDEKLKIIFAPGHQPEGIVLYEEKNKGLFVDDIVGNYFADADVHYTLNPILSDHMQSIETLRKLMKIPLNNLYLGHYGISQEPERVMSQAIKDMQDLLDMGAQYVREGKADQIADKMYEMTLPQLEKLREVRGKAIYEYATKEHIAHQKSIFAKYCLDKFGK